MIYNQNLPLLFSHIEAKKFLSDGKTKEKIKKEKFKKKIENCDKKIIKMFKILLKEKELLIIRK